MTRRELREEIFKLLFMVEFYSKEEMAEQVKSYFEDFPEKEISEKDHAYIEEKYENICAVLPDDLRGIKLIAAVPLVDADAPQNCHRLTIFQLKSQALSET